VRVSGEVVRLGNVVTNRGAIKLANALQSRPYAFKRRRKISNSFTARTEATAFAYFRLCLVYIAEQQRRYWIMGFDQLARQSDKRVQY